MQLTSQQASKVLTARRCLLEKLRKVGQERRQLLSALGLQLLQTPQDRWAQSPPVQRLQNNLGQERAAASAFLFSTIDEVKTCTQPVFDLYTPAYSKARDQAVARPLVQLHNSPVLAQLLSCCLHLTGVTALHVCLQVLTIQQEAFLDSHSYPWCPDIWQMAQLLAAGKAEPDMKIHTADLDMSGVALNTLLPEKTGFQLLVQPLRARGLGLRLKRE